MSLQICTAKQCLELLSYQAACEARRKTAMCAADLNVPANMRCQAVLRAAVPPVSQRTPPDGLVRSRS